MFALVALGALTVTISTFLPWQESPSFRRDRAEHAHSARWLDVDRALIGGGRFRVTEWDPGKTDKWWGPLILIGLCALILLIDSNSSDTLYPVKPDGEVDTSQPGCQGESRDRDVRRVARRGAHGESAHALAWSNVRSRQDAGDVQSSQLRRLRPAKRRTSDASTAQHIQQRTCQREQRTSAKDAAGSCIRKDGVLAAASGVGGQRDNISVAERYPGPIARAAAN